MVDELSEAEHSTFTITPKQEECLQAGCVWEIVDSWDDPKSKIEEIAAYYGLTYSRVMCWKKYWMKLTHGWKTLQMTLEAIVTQTYIQEIKVLVSETTKLME